MLLRLPYPKTKLPARIGGLLATARRHGAAPDAGRFPAFRKAEAYLAAQAGQDFARRRVRIPDAALVPLARGIAVAPASTALGGGGLRGFVANDNRSGRHWSRILPRLRFWSLLLLTFLVAVASAYLSGRSQAQQRVILVPDAAHFGSAIA